MIDTLSSDIEKEMAVAKTEEADAQADYEETIKAPAGTWEVICVEPKAV